MRANRLPEWRGNNAAIIRETSLEVLSHGPAGTGKTFTDTSKFHEMAIRFPGAQFLFVRKTLVSLTASAVQTYKNDVLPMYPGVPVKFYGGSQQEPPAFQYWNGSRIYLAGMDNPQKALSRAFDGILAVECNELELNDWEILTSRLRAGNIQLQSGELFHQILGECNPDTPTHWIMKRANEGKLKMFATRHEDNPRYFNADGTQTPAGAAYMRVLDNLTGVRYKRYRLGLWVAAEGQVYEEFDPHVHVISRAKFEAEHPNWREYPTLWAVDFGFDHAFVWQEWAQDADGRLYLLQEIYRSHRLVSDHAKDIKYLTQGRQKPRALVCDHDAEGRATLERELDMKTKGAVKAVLPGIEAVKLRLRVQADGKPRLFLLADSLTYRDPERVERKLSTSTQEDLTSYVWDTSNSRSKGEQPLKQYDDGADPLRYAVVAIDGLGRARVKFGPVA